jgi:Gram-negative bacterial TonB protein C-terminal
MARKRFVRPFVIASFVALGSFLAAPVGTSMLWAAAHDQPRMMNKKPTMKAPATETSATTAPSSTPLLMTQTPTTVDDYASYVGDLLQAQAMQIKTPGTADVRLTIGRDGSVRQAEVTRLDGPATLRNQITSMANQLKLPPLPADARADELVVDSTLAFNYPGSEIMDRFGRRSERR